MTIVSFRAQFPEFKNAPDTFVQAFLDAALLQIDATVWRTKADQGQAYLAAHEMALSPWGNAMRLISKDGTTPYWKHYEDLRDSVASGYLVI